MSPAVRNRLSRWGRFLIPVAILAITLLSVGTVSFVEVSSQPWFCKSCHIMQPYYESWATSSHRDVACIECHIPPGIKSEVQQKIQAANMVVKYFTGAYGTRPWAEIQDASCLRSGCHSDRLIEGVVDFHGVRFDHAQHLGEIRRGMQLHCTSCHSQIVQGTHIAVTEGTCFLCHFKNRPAGQPLAGCTGCHPSPPTVTSPEGLVIDHAQYVRDRIDCLSCHNQVTQGVGDVDQARCVSCHNEPARLAQFSNTTLIHQVHVSQHNIACIQCHTPIEHRVVSLTTTVELDCRSCHRSVHQDEQKLFAGIGGHGVKPTPSSMYLARVSCVACHDQAARLPGHDTVQIAGEASCLSCHGIRYANVLPGWQREMQRKVGLVAPVVDAAQAAAAAAPLRRRATVDSLLGLAQHNVDFVRAGKGAHNIVYADQLLRASLALVRQAVQDGSLPYHVPAVDLGPPVSENACLQCHLGVERQQGTFQGVTFNHTAHVLQAGLQCSECHTPFSQHGGITLASTASCNACHHPVMQPGNCARCHAGPGGAPADTIGLPAGVFSHRAHVAANLPCTACHTAPVMSARDLQCDNCHEQHHQPQAACLNCHRGGALAKHTRQDHVACVQCHRTVPHINHWTRQVCTACHAAQTNHFPGRSCELCHQIPAMGTTRAAAPPPPPRSQPGARRETGGV
jgi:nitrate/TMAO reductase-like tetraheme cytochrome c subunit